jgi:hypothetical protein
MHQGQLAAAARGSGSAAATAGGAGGSAILARIASRGLLQRKGGAPGRGPADAQPRSRRMSEAAAAAAQLLTPGASSAAMGACAAMGRQLAGWLKSEPAAGRASAAGAELVEGLATALLMLLQVGRVG